MVQRAPGGRRGVPRRDPRGGRAGTRCPRARDRRDDAAHAAARRARTPRGADAAQAREARVREHHRRDRRARARLRPARSRTRADRPDRTVAAARSLHLRGAAVRRLVAAAVAIGLLAVAAAAAEARDGYITSFDGTTLVYSFFPAPGLRPGQRTSTVIVGPGYSSGRASSSDAEVSMLRSAGYNVLTWDPRGFGDSGGNVEIDSPDYEARDASKLIDFLAAQPEVQLDRPGDPHLGMAGPSYGGGIQWITAAIDPRVDVIAPQISWHSLVTSLDKANTAKGGWGGILFGLGVEGTTLPGATGGVSGQPAGFQFGRSQDPAANRALIDGAATGELTPADQAFFAARGPDFLLSRVHVPTLILQSTSDTLFTLKEAIQNYAAMRAQGVPLKMLWFCGSLSSPSLAHGICETNQGPDPSIALHETVRWMNRYLRGNRGDRKSVV